MKEYKEQKVEFVHTGIKKLRATIEQVQRCSYKHKAQSTWVGVPVKVSLSLKIMYFGNEWNLSMHGE